MKPKSNQKVMITSGYYNPIHIGHVNLMRHAKELGDFLVVIVNNDDQVIVKGSIPFMLQDERLAIVKAIKYVDEAFLSVDKDGTVAESLRAVAKKYPGSELFFAKGGDRHSGNIPENETKVCQEYNIQVIDAVGGGKVQSSSQLLRDVVDKNQK